MDKKIPGFSLIETAFVLLIAGIIAGLTFPLLSATRQLERQKITQNNQESLLHALAGYVLKYNHLPAPSMPESEGKGYCNSLEKSVCVGIIPYQDLGISEAAAKDGYGNWFTYVVGAKLTGAGGTNNYGSDVISMQKNSFCQISSSGINLTTLAKKPVLEPAEKITEHDKDHIAVILISHGPKGSGAFCQRKNQRLAVQYPALENENTTESTQFLTRSNNDDKSDFTHQVYWLTRNNLMAVYAKHPCQSEYNSSLSDNSGQLFSLKTGNKNRQENPLSHDLGRISSYPSLQRGYPNFNKVNPP